MKTVRKIAISKAIVKPSAAAIAALLVARSTALPGFAQASPMTRAWSVYIDQQTAIQAAGGHNITWGNAARFDHFLDRHSGLAEQLYQSPGVLRDPGFLGHHEALRDHLATNPGIREELIGAPSCLSQREARFKDVQNHERAITRVDLDTLDGYLDGHPDAAAALYADPSLAANTDFLGRYPELALFFHNHPVMAAQLHGHPGWLRWREKSCAPRAQ
jgi:hypothetical protein